MPREDDRLQLYRELALEAPRVTALSDEPLSGDEAFRDSFNLDYWLGPVYDLLRHPDTRTPFAVAVYGAWGSGKTTAMRWLEGLLEHWNAAPREQAPVKVRTVWFFPWKYQSREDVWRGLVAEVVLRCMTLEDADVHAFTKAAKDFGLFLGRGFLHVLSGLKVKTPAGDMGLGGLEKVLEDAQRFLRPEKAYLNEFEDALTSWIHESLGPDDRLLVFIDDLDRCMPEVALEVLEALKLYLNIRQLIFIVGVDRPVIDQLVGKHYDDLGLSEDKSLQYLSKMFQVEIDLAPSTRQIAHYLENLLERLPAWTNELGEPERKVFLDVILELAGRNPREVKRLVNSALMRGVGVSKSRGGSFDFSQGLQLFFVRRRLQLSHPQQKFLVGHPLGDEFFGAWSRKVRDPEVSGDVLNADQFKDLAALLDDSLLEKLMRIEYPEDTSGMVEAFEVDPWLVEHVARQLGKEPGEVTRREYFSVEELSLRGLEITDLDGLRGLGTLRRLDLSGTPISDLEPLASLGALRRLDLTRTEVIDLAPLASLESLEDLSLKATRVRDLEPLRDLGSLRTLNLSLTQVSDLGPLEGLHGLRKLYLGNTEVGDLKPLGGLRSLERLDLRRTRAGDLTPLRALSSLKRLGLLDAAVSEDEIESLRQLLPELEIER